MARKSRLPAGGTNLFQAIKAKRAAAEASGIRILNLAIGQPQGPALLSARKAAAEAVLSDRESMHEYQDNGTSGVPEFSERFVAFHTGDLSGCDMAYLPIPGIKPMLGLIPIACGCVSTGIEVMTTTDPGYPTPADWCGYLSGVRHRALSLNPANMFRFCPGDIRAQAPEYALVMMNYPHNPSGQVATVGWLVDLCAYCAEHGIRLFNDAAYVALKHTSECATLAEVAVNYPDLSWAEAFSASKLIANGTGWRVGAMVGSPDFIGDIAKIKGNTDSGFVAPMAAGALAALERDQEGIATRRQVYQNRIHVLRDVLESRGMKLAVAPGAGFFTLWKVPNRAFGQRIETAERFNYLMVERTGVTGVHFHPYIRYAVVGPVEDMRHDLECAFDEADVSYD